MAGAYTSEGMAELLGVTYRQLDYWIREGFIDSTPVNGGENRRSPGTGKSRVWVGREVDEAVWFARLVRIGMKPSEIGNIHQRLVRNGHAVLPFGLRIVIEGASQ